MHEAANSLRRFVILASLKEDVREKMRKAGRKMSIKEVSETYFCNAEKRSNLHPM